MNVEERFQTLLPLARRRARSYEFKFYLDFGELVTPAMLGAWKAAQTWDEEKGDLNSWAWQKIDGCILDEFRHDVNKWGGSRKEHCRKEIFSLDEIVMEGKKSDEGKTLADFIPDECAEEDIYRIENFDLVRALKMRMCERDWDILKSYVCEEETMKSIGRRYGLSESRICQIMPGILHKARRIIEGMYSSDEEGLAEYEWLKT